MGLGDPYTSVTNLKVHTDIDSENNRLDPVLASVIQSASDEVEKFCHRQFNRVETATPRRYKPLTATSVYTDDFWTTDGLVVAVDTYGSNTYSTILTPVDYELYPMDGIVDGQSGWPFWKIKLLGWHRFDPGYTSVRVTAKWGWETVPDLVVQATTLLANETFAMRGAPLGVAGSNSFGEVRLRENRLVQNKLRRFIRDPIMVGG